MPDAWVYVGSGSSIPAAIAFHIAQNVGGELVSVPGAEDVELAVWAALAVAVTLGRRRWMRVPVAPE